MNEKELISIIVPVYNEEKNIVPFHAEIAGVFSDLPDYDFEIIFINDGSKDNSILEINRIAESDKRIRILDFSRNFGKEIAMTAGCHFAKGGAAITMDADLQHPPELISEFIKKWREGNEVVYTIRRKNKGASLTKKITSKMYWWLFDKISSVQTEPHSTDFRLIDKKVIETFKKFPERGRIFRATYSYGKLFRLAINSITAFSLLPLRLAGYLGIIITSISFILLLIMAITEIFNKLFFTVMAFVVVGNTLLIGIVLVCLGFIALYIARIHDEVTGRPLYIIRNKINFE